VSRVVNGHPNIPDHMRDAVIKVENRAGPERRVGVLDVIRVGRFDTAGRRESGPMGALHPGECYR
jgi:hypothetical protein